MYQIFEERITKDHVPAICLVDRDLKFLRNGQYPKIGGTADNIVRVYNRLHRQVQPPLFDKYVINAHEAENLIPIAALETLSIRTPEICDGLSYLKKLIDAGCTQAVLLYDLKNGDTDLKNPKKAIAHADALIYWDQIGHLVGDTNMPRFCGGLLEKAVALLENSNCTSSYITNIQIDDYLATSWNEIGLMLLSWGCANKRTST